MMRLTILLPGSIFLEKDVTKIRAEAENGEFSLLPKHIDFAAVLTAGILSYEDADQKIAYVAVNGGTLVKVGARVWVSTRNAVADAPLGRLEQTVEEQFKILDDSEKKARTAMAKIEAGIIRKFLTASNP
ncbi:MAG: F0F1 ATP synthase subunit epsilon [Desulfobacterales bacterium]